MKSVNYCIICLICISGLHFLRAAPHDLPDPYLKEYLTAKPDTTPAQKIRLPQDKIDPIQLKDPSALEKDIQYDPETNKYIITEKLGGEILNSTSMTFEEYVKYKNKQLQQNYFNDLSGNSDGKKTFGRPG